MTAATSLSPLQLYNKCDPAQFTFESTGDLPILDEIIGQPRAVDAIRFGTNMRSDGYNVFAIGSNGVGKHTAVTQFIEHKAANEETPDEWCYIHNFDRPHQPRALRVAPGVATQLSADMRRLIEELLTVIPAAFEGDDFRQRRDAIENEMSARQEQALQELKKESEQHQIALMTAPDGMGFVPLIDGKTMSPDQFNQLPAGEKQRIDRAISDLQDRLQALLRQVPHWQRELQNRLKQIRQEMTTVVIAPLFAEMNAKYAFSTAIKAYLETVRLDVIENYNDFLETESPSLPGTMPATARIDGRENMPQRYQVNVLVDHTQTQGAPVVYEVFPTYQNLVGRVEHISHLGALVTNFTLIKPGSLQRANGGYLIIEVRQLLQQPYAWDGLKRALRTKEIKIEALGQIYSLVSTVSLEPEPIPLDVKVVLLGEPQLYYLLCAYDPDFTELFKVSADFEYNMPRSAENNMFYARLIGTLANKEQLRQFDKHAVARIIEHSSRLAADATKLTTHMQSIADVLREANYWANEAGHELIRVEDIEHAIEAQIYRQNRIQIRMQEYILYDMVLIDTDGSRVGQINGLSVLQLGSYAFGKPSRITARVRLGKGEIIDIERQVELGGPTHSKGVLILSGFLAARYAGEQPFALSASLVFEQSYSGVEGDSASSAELYCLLSALADVPIKQSLAVTGSVNQHGEIQAIGGVNEKIEGFFDICLARGLTGEQGVLIPEANVRNLMLRHDVVAAVERDAFHIYAVSQVDEGIALLTGLEAGKTDENGMYPANSLNGKVVARLRALADTQKALLRPGNGHTEAMALTMP